MGRYIGPVCRLCRREGAKLFLKGDRCLTGKCAINRKKGAPGVVKQKRGKVSNYGLQLREKQKVKRFYAVSESQFRKYYEMASRAQGNTGELLVQYLERRLDNVVYRLGFAVSRNQARQVISHGLVEMNDRKASIASMMVRKGDVIKIKENKRQIGLFDDNIKRENTLPTWLEKMDDFSGKVMELPTRDIVTDVAFKEQMIVELYSK
ncbi:MAG: 30S ribosomal protein S4 [Spirochaetae bacterium HGW-Spirochaetae-6]|jgi:small subunit ribosomal protein S4|nr:MAG: 30S ribosomal protein S4 [Spirochaetae bacterium HGW-Spirochaetae-6]